MTSIFLIRNDRVLLLYRVGSEAIPDSWVGIGGHVEPNEINNPTEAALRELKEEVGIAPERISDLALRYVTLRDTGQELRLAYYFTATLHADTPEPTECAEGTLRWFDIASDLDSLPMPPTVAVALDHWLTEGRHDQLLRAIVMTAAGPQVLPFATP
jgi:8-oxo-dGTP diphosphatase